MSSYFPTMKINTKFSVEPDDMYTVHGHAGNLSRTVILESLRKIIHSRSACKTKQPISIADFGTADGRASLAILNEMIDIISIELGQKQAVVLYYNDQPKNNFNQLSQVIGGYGHAHGLNVTSSVYPVIVPRTMYEQCLPDNTIDLAISSIATHYLSKQVCQIKHGVFMGEADIQEQSLMKEQGKADWRKFVISRGRELKPGGYLITMNASSDKDNNATTYIDKGLGHLGSFVSEMVKEGVITQEEYIATNFHIHYMRTAADFEEPFVNDVPAVEELGLELVSLKTIHHHFQHPLFDSVSKDDTEKLEYSRRIVAMVYPWFHHVLYGGLSLSRTEDEKEMVIDHYFRKLQTYAFEHSDNKPYINLTEVIIKKRVI